MRKQPPRRTSGHRQVTALVGEHDLKANRPAESIAEDALADSIVHLRLAKFELLAKGGDSTEALALAGLQGELQRLQGGQSVRVDVLLRMVRSLRGAWQEQLM